MHFLSLQFSALFATNNTFSDQVMGYSYLTFNYTAVDCCVEVGHIVHQSEKGFEVLKRERK